MRVAGRTDRATRRLEACSRTQDVIAFGQVRGASSRVDHRSNETSAYQAGSHGQTARSSAIQTIDGKTSSSPAPRGTKVVEADGRASNRRLLERVTVCGGGTGGMRVMAGSSIDGMSATAEGASRGLPFRVRCRRGGPAANPGGEEHGPDPAGPALTLHGRVRTVDRGTALSTSPFGSHAGRCGLDPCRAIPARGLRYRSWRR